MDPGTKTTTSKLAKLQRAAAWVRDTGLGTGGVVLLMVVTAAGWGASTIGLMDFADTHMGYHAWKRFLVPITFDGAAMGLSVSAFRAAINGRSALFARVGIIGFTALSCWMNYTHIADPVGKPVGALLPVSAVVLMESLLAEARRAHEARTGQPRPRIHPLRWWFDRDGTTQILRAHVLGLPLPEQLAAAQKQLADEQVAEVEAETVRSARRRRPRPQQQAPGTVAPEPVPVPPAVADAVTEVIPVVTEDGPGRRVAEVIELQHGVPERPVWLTEDMTAKEALCRYLDSLDNPDAPKGPELTRLLRAWGFDVNDDSGRTYRNRWRRDRSEQAVGE